MSFSIGSLSLGSPVLLAPMSGVTDLPFRRLARRLGAGLVYSEMIASSQMVRAHRETLRMSTPCDDEHPMAVQLAGNEPQIMAEAAKMNVDRGAALIDINMGCPVKKVVKGSAGSALMRDEDLAARIMEAVVKAVSVPVTVKMRLGWDRQTMNAPRLARIAEETGLALVTVHGRTRDQLYSGTADWDAVRAVTEAISIPVVVNGDIVSPETAQEAMRRSGAQAVMVGRGCQGRPWLPGRLAAVLAGKDDPGEPGLIRRREILLDHFDALLAHYGDHLGVRTARKHVAWSLHGLPDAARFKDHFNQINDPMEARDSLVAFFETVLSFPSSPCDDKVAA